MSGVLPLPLIDACALDERRRGLLRPDQLAADREGRMRRLPRFFYEVDSWQTALNTPVSEHFTLHEFMGVDVREARTLRIFPRYVPCAVTLLAAHLEVFRREVDNYVHIAANGGYRSPGHGLADYASPHCWGVAANIYKIGDELIDTQERIERYSRIMLRALPSVWIRPFGTYKGFADDHLHVDLGYVVMTPRESPAESAT